MKLMVKKSAQKVYPESLDCARDKLSRRGFTLIELLVVITIIAILSTIGLVAYSSVQKSARDAKRRSNLHDFQVVLQQYYINNKKFPSGAFSSCSTSGVDNWQDFGAFLAPYLNKIPVDPKNTIAALPEAYCYYYGSNTGPIDPAGNVSPDIYVLGARLENAPNFDISVCPGRYDNFCPGSGCTGYHDVSSGVNNFYGACSVNYVILGK